MGRKRHSTEQIIRRLREAGIELAQGQSTKAVCKKLRITEQTCYRWRMEYGGLRMDQARRFKQIERENGGWHPSPDQPCSCAHHGAG